MKKWTRYESRFEQFITKYSEELVRWRRDFHQHPELGWMEYRTTFKIAQILEKLSYDVIIGREVLSSSFRLGLPDRQQSYAAVVRAKEEGVPEEYLEQMVDGHTGLVAKLDTGKEGPHIALRFDIDALPIQEFEDAKHDPYRLKFHSKHPGVMHACGHDGHMTIGLGLAHFIHECREELTGTFTLLFQPAEEGSRGAKAMVEKGWLEGVDYFLAGHIGFSVFELGEVAASTSNFLATTKLNVEFKGKSAHAGQEPQNGRNALQAGAAAALQIHSIPRHGEGITRVNVGKMNAGEGRNIIPEYSLLELETRGQTTDLNQYMVKEVKRIITAAAMAYDVQAGVEIVGEGISSSCDQELTYLIQKLWQGSSRIKQIKESAELGASEDVCYMLQRVKEQGGQATYMLFGSPLEAGHHHPLFDYREEVLEVAIEAFSRIVYHLSTGDEQGNDHNKG
ncbi:amidohydrolase [Bacillus horti]|uniref:Aminobenzoyl-glutamate utilization protein A n=1 Tax=Caldalkalibacillus horti TaxID=77523 RepID=A0ABT9W2U3_9BACI|nr:amidohydrolase [Bacillus horti]MDQ0167387.1 aminobenzoyl-glutamate utilization protein A [Bacillus horti]